MCRLLSVELRVRGLGLGPEKGPVVRGLRLRDLLKNPKPSDPCVEIEPDSSLRVECGVLDRIFVVSLR